MPVNPRQPPSSWCPEACDLFVPVRCLGVGGFGAVWLAKRKKNNNSTSSSKNSVNGTTSSASAECAITTTTTTTTTTEPSDEVAIKVVGHAHNQKINSFEQISEAGYFKREVSILQEISNPRIVRCLQVIEDKRPDSSCAPYCMVLEYCRGPTIEQLLKHGGAFGLSFAQEVSSQLIEVVSYLHGRAVIHRDIKPDNIIVNGARLSDEATWSDDNDGVGNDAAKKIQWNIKLIDFGFARPLRPDDIVNESNALRTKKEPSDGFFGTVDNQLDDASLHRSAYGVTSKNSNKNNNKNKSNKNSNRGDFLTNNNDEVDLSASISRFAVKGLSAVGNRNYAAPEITNGVRVFKAGKKKTNAKNSNDNTNNKEQQQQQQQQQQEPLTECVSDYGMIVDAFSTGATIRYMCLGIPPQISVDDFWQEKNSMMRVLGRKFKKAIGKKKNKDSANTTTKRKKKYRTNNDLPSEAVGLILGMTHWNAKKRTTVRSARNYEWIASSYSMKNDSIENKIQKNHPLSEADHHGGGAKLDFLKCAM